MNVPPWHRLSEAEVVRRLAGDPVGGLGSRAAERLLRIHGPNLLPEVAAAPFWSIIIGQFRDFMVLVLLAAAAFSIMLGETVDSIAITAIVLLNALLGSIQEFRAERSLAALRRLSAPTARVVRDGEAREIPASDVVPGDLLLIEAGDRMAADARLLEATSLEADESPLTGESVPAGKRPAVCGEGEGRTPGDRMNMVFQGTVITRGRGRALVVATGIDTEVGGIAGLIQEAGIVATPLQRRLSQLGRYLVAACLAVSVLVVVGGLWRGEDLYRMVMTGISLAVASIPEGLPAVVTIVLALGVQKMLARNAIIRRLAAVETLGCTTVICTDKTGTLTRNEMTVRRIHTADQRYEVTGEGYCPGGMILSAGRPIGGRGELDRLLTGMAVCNNARLLRGKGMSSGAVGNGRGQSGDADGWRVEGDPTEGALLVAVRKAGLDPEDVRARHSRLLEIPFDSERKAMSVVCRTEAGIMFMFIKGAPEAVLSVCSRVRHRKGQPSLTEGDRAHYLALADGLAADGLRVLAIGGREVSSGELASIGVDRIEPARMERDLALLGFVGMMDPPRPEAREAVKRCRGAGLRVVMITGDHALTAVAVAREVGILDAGNGQVAMMSGRELDDLNDAALARRVERVAVFSRVSPSHKLWIVRALRGRGHVVAMTGDGVNDAPALKEADIGVAMGISGTEVSREAADMVLADDNFSTIVAAVEEGRSIYSNIRKFIRYLLSCNAGEVMVMLGATVLGFPLPLLPIHILMVNLVTDGLPAIALGVDPPTEDLMSRPPRDPREGVFSDGLWARIIGRGVLIGLTTLIWFAGAVILTGDLDRSRTIAMAVLSGSQLLFAFECRSETLTLRQAGILGNRALVWATLSSLLVLVAVVHVPFLADILHTVPLTMPEWGAVLLGSMASSLLAAAQRTIFKRGARRPECSMPAA